MKTPEQRKELKKYLREKCRIDSESGVYLLNHLMVKDRLEDTWRTFGTSQKVSGFGNEMRDCIKGKVDSDRKNNENSITMYIRK